MMLSKWSCLVIANLLSVSIAQIEPSKQGIKFVPHYSKTSELTPVKQTAVNGHRLHQNTGRQEPNKKAESLAKKDAQVGGGSDYSQQFQGGQVSNPYQQPQNGQMEDEGQQGNLKYEGSLQNISATVSRLSNVAVPSTNSISYPLSKKKAGSAITGVTPTATGAIPRVQSINSSENAVPSSNSLVPANNGSVNGTGSLVSNTSTLPPGITSIPTSDVASANLSQKASDMTRFTNGQIVPSDFDAQVSLSTTTPSSAFTFMSPSLYTQTLQTVRNNQQEWYTLTRVTMVLVTSTPAGAKSIMNTSVTQSGNIAKGTGKGETGSKSGKDSSDNSKGENGSSESSTVEGEESGSGSGNSSSGSETAAQNSGPLSSMMMSSTVLLLMSGSFIFL